MKKFKNTIYREAGKTAKTTMSGISEGEVGPPAEYGGDPNTLNPEEMFVASINSCIMLVFYLFVEKLRATVRSYAGEAEGVVEKTPNGLRFTSVHVRAEVGVDADDSETRGKIEEIARLAEKHCLVSNSVACPVSYEVCVVDA